MPSTKLMLCGASAILPEWGWEVHRAVGIGRSGLSTWKYQFSYDHWSQATLSSVSTWVGYGSNVARVLLITVKRRLDLIFRVLFTGCWLCVDAELAIGQCRLGECTGLKKQWKHTQCFYALYNFSFQVRINMPILGNTCGRISPSNLGIYTSYILCLLYTSDAADE